MSCYVFVWFNQFWFINLAVKKVVVIVMDVVVWLLVSPVIGWVTTIVVTNVYIKSFNGGCYNPISMLEHGTTGTTLLWLLVVF